MSPRTLRQCSRMIGPGTVPLMAIAIPVRPLKEMGISAITSSIGSTVAALSDGSAPCPACAGSYIPLAGRPIAAESPAPNMDSHNLLRFTASGAFSALTLLFVLILTCDRLVVASGTNPMAGFVMRSSETHDGNSVISLSELELRKTVPAFAWKKYRAALAEDDKRHYSASFRLATSAAALWPTFPQVHTALALWYLRDHDSANALSEIRAALNLDPRYLPATELLGIDFFIRGELSQARETLDSVVLDDPTRELAQYFLGQTLSKLGDSTSATDHLEVALRLRRHRPKPVIPDSEPSPSPD